MREKKCRKLFCSPACAPSRESPVGIVSQAADLLSGMANTTTYIPYVPQYRARYSTETTPSYWKITSQT